MERSHSSFANHMHHASTYDAQDHGRYHDRERGRDDYELGENYGRIGYGEKGSILYIRGRDRRRWTVLTAFLFLAAYLGTYRLLRLSDTREDRNLMEIQEKESAIIENDMLVQPVPTYPQEVIGPPTESFWDNLRNDTQYITGWVDAGWTNNFMTIVNLIYVALLANRTVVLPPSVPIHIPWEAGFPYFSTVIAIPRLSSAIRVPIIEWSDLKSKTSSHLDKLGCWSTWAHITEFERSPRNGFTPGFLRVDASYTPVPKDVKLFEDHKTDPHVRLASLAALTFDEGHIQAHLPQAAPFPGHTGHRQLPSTHIACFDFLYYASAVEPFEYEHDFAPAWSFVGTHAHWTTHILSVTRKIIAETFNVNDESDIPPFISMHIRHGDFARQCPNITDPFTGCFAPLSTFAARVDDVRIELRAKGIIAEHVLVTSDEEDRRWWSEVREFGWTWIDHEAVKTAELFGAWYPVFVDAVAQSLGAGFVGTKSSTMSLMAGRRVTDWNDGPVRYVKWDEGRL